MENATGIAQGIELVRAREVCRRMKFGRTTLWSLCKAGEFPKPIKTGRNSIAWRSDELQEWIETRERA